MESQSQRFICGISARNTNDKSQLFKEGGGKTIVLLLRGRKVRLPTKADLHLYEPILFQSIEKNESLRFWSSENAWTPLSYRNLNSDYSSRRQYICHTKWDHCKKRTTSRRYHISIRIKSSEPICVTVTSWKNVLATSTQSNHKLNHQSFHENWLKKVNNQMELEYPSPTNLFKKERRMRWFQKTSKNLEPIFFKS